MSETSEIPVLTDLVTDDAAVTTAVSVDPQTREAIMAELREFMHGTLRNQMSNAMEEVIDDLCKQANDKLEALLDKHLGK